MTSDRESSYRAIENLIARYALLVGTGCPGDGHSTGVGGLFTLVALQSDW
ncbi:MAG TPA: hypothetical protein VJ914_29650 [Pseudonocardiaceae bacterium]|nr:hypothetical protein [Pseudonocardiaceae bacterium]